MKNRDAWLPRSLYVFLLLYLSLTLFTGASQGRPFPYGIHLLGSRRDAHFLTP